MQDCRERQRAPVQRPPLRRLAYEREGSQSAIIREAPDYYLDSNRS